MANLVTEADIYSRLLERLHLIAAFKDRSKHVGDFVAVVAKKLGRSENDSGHL